MPNLTAAEFITRLTGLGADPKDAEFTGLKMGEIFKLGKEFSDMPVAEIERLMDSPVQKIRVGALSIMGQCAKGKKCTPERLAELYALYIRRHDRINDWGLVDLAAYYVVGQYLADKPRDILYKLARSKDQWERRTAIVATAHFILKLKQVDDTFAIAQILVKDQEKFVQTGVGWMLRTAGDVDRPGLLKFLDKHAGTMPRVPLRYAIEKLDKEQRAHYLRLKTKV
jgi:3-methyladenine DNA glycosylase AlkD